MPDPRPIFGGGARFETLGEALPSNSAFSRRNLVISASVLENELAIIFPKKNATLLCIDYVLSRGRKSVDEEY
jgi:hypothetical protein